MYINDIYGKMEIIDKSGVLEVKYGYVIFDFQREEIMFFKFNMFLIGFIRYMFFVDDLRFRERKNFIYIEVFIVDKFDDVKFERVQLVINIIIIIIMEKLVGGIVILL